MGFTHYWKPGKKNTTVPTARIDAANQAIKIILSEHKDILANGSGDEGTQPEEEAGHLYYNGIGDEAHETMVVHTDPAGLPAFSFCKTARKEYDKVVVACLATLAYHWGDAIDISSDGDPDDWQEGFTIAAKHIEASDKENLLTLIGEDNSFHACFAKHLAGR